MVGESAYIKLCCRDEKNGMKTLKVALIQAGKQTVSVDLTQNYDIMKAAGADKKLHLKISVSLHNRKQIKTTATGLTLLPTAIGITGTMAPIPADLRFFITRAAFYS